MLRAIILSLALFIGLGALIPLATDYSEAAQKKQRKSKKRSAKKFSKEWWKEYRARKRGNSSLAQRKEAMRLKQLRLAKDREEEIARNGGKWIKVTHLER